VAQHSLSDRVAIVSMGCTRFAEHFDKSADALAVDAVTEALDGAGLAPGDIDAFWLGTYVSGISGTALSRPLRLTGKPVTRVENMCATGSEALRAAVHAVACGAVDVAMAVGVEKLKDTGYAGLISPKIQDDGTRVNTSARRTSACSPQRTRTVTASRRTRFVPR
jgi:acetyl-CoA C-acetyltransferase